MFFCVCCDKSEAERDSFRDGQTGGQTDRYTDFQRGKWTGRQTDGQIGR